ncbi:hypothetical protein ACS0TY_025113 [Phlomoides rotata]
MTTGNQSRPGIISKPGVRTGVRGRSTKVEVTLRTCIDNCLGPRNRRSQPKMVGVTYTIEFQKGGLPHTHILLFLSRENKIPNLEDVDRIISA